MERQRSAECQIAEFGVKGWFAVKRGITNHHLFKGKPDRLAVWLWLLDNAAWKNTTHDVQGRTISVPRGAVCASERQIASECGIGYQVARTAIARFKREHMINAEVTHGKNLITLCNYEKYQDPENAYNAPPNASLTQEQRKPNAQKEQGNKVTRDTSVSLDARAVEILGKVSSQETAASFVAHRRELKKPLTERAASAMVKKLDGHPNPDAVLTDSIANGWQGIFPEKTIQKLTSINGARGNDGHHQTRSQRQMAAFIAGARGTGGAS